MHFYSQHGEDEALWSYFKGRTHGVCVEVGGFDGETFSNTLTFEEQGWKTIIVEPMPHFAEKIRIRRPESIVFACAAGSKKGETKLVTALGVETLSTTTLESAQIDRILRMGGQLAESTVPVLALDQILAESGVASIDFITIDVEGAELDVLAGFDLSKWKPQVVILENGNVKLNGLLQDEMKRRNYCYLTTTGDCNEWYVPRDADSVNVSLKLKGYLRRMRIRFRNFEETSGLKRAERCMRRFIKKS